MVKEFDFSAKEIIINCDNKQAIFRVIHHASILRFIQQEEQEQDEEEQEDDEDEEDDEYVFGDDYWLSTFYLDPKQFPISHKLPKQVCKDLSINLDWAPYSWF